MSSVFATSVTPDHPWRDSSSITVMARSTDWTKLFLRFVVSMQMYSTLVVVFRPNLLRRLMHNWSDQEVREVTQRSTERSVEPLPERVGRHLGGQADEQATQRLRSVALQGEEVRGPSAAR